MRKELETYQLIDQYLNQTLSREELRSFEKRMQEEEAFAEEVRHQQLVKEVIIGAEMDKLREKMQQDISGLNKRTDTAKWWLGGFLGLLMIGSIGYALLRQPAQPQENDVVEKNIAPPADNKKNTSDEVEVEVEVKKSSEKNVPDKKTLNTAIQPKEKTPLASDVEFKEDVLPVSIAEPDNTPTPSENPFYNPPAKKAPEVNCGTITIVAQPSIQGTCPGEWTGSITLYSRDIKGGTTPYQLSLNDQKALSDREVFAGLQSGKHILYIRDAAGCIKTQEVLIPEKDCHKIAKFAINPALGESWQIPLADTQTGKLTIYDGSGIVIYKAVFGNGVQEWNGSDMSGAISGSGVYMYILEYHNGKKDSGQITIIR